MELQCINEHNHEDDNGLTSMPSAIYTSAWFGNANGPGSYLCK